MNELLEITETLCDSIRREVCGCEGCPLFYQVFYKDKATASFYYEKDCPFYQWKDKNGLTE